MAILRSYRSRYRLKTFVETGTYVGTTLADLEGDFSELISIELGEELYARARRRFDGHPRIRLFHGDSAAVLPQLVASLTAPTLFWLDGHWSEGDTAKGSMDTPIRGELEAVFNGTRGGGMWS